MISILDLFSKNPYSRIPNSALKSIDNIRTAIGDQISKANKEYKVYSKGPVNFTIKKTTVDRKRNNQTYAMSKSIPKAIIGVPVLEKKVFSSKVIEREKPARNRETDRRRTLPKMKAIK